MRFAAWNCRSGGLDKWAALEQRGVDVAVLSEVTRTNPAPTADLLGQGLSWVAEGPLPSKAVAVVSRNELRVLPSREGQGEWCVAAETGMGPSVLGIYSSPVAGGGGRAYEEQVLACLDAWADELASGDMLVAGDFNIGSAVVGGITNNAWMSGASARWAELGLVSVYHHFFGEDLAAPTRATFYLRYHEDQPWHIDYVLIHRSRLNGLRGVEVGRYDEWVRQGVIARSDHVPVIVDLDW